MIRFTGMSSERHLETDDPRLWRKYSLVVGEEMALTIKMTEDSTMVPKEFKREGSAQMIKFTTLSSRVKRRTKSDIIKGRFKI